MNIFEYNEEKVLRMTKEEGYEMGSQYGEIRGRILERCKDVKEGDYSMERAAKKLDIPLEQFECYYEEFIRTGKISLEHIE
jgi:hypothetical protein